MGDVVWTGMHGVKRRRVPNTNITLFTWRWSSAKFFNYLHMLLQSPDQTKPMIGFPLQWFPNSTKPYLICFVSQFLPFCLSLASCCYLCHVCLFRQAVAFLFRSSLAQPVLPLPCEAETKHLSNSERQPLWGGTGTTVHGSGRQGLGSLTTRDTPTGYEASVLKLNWSRCVSHIRIAV